MAWCPICKCEYKDGIEKCADCKVDLVASLENMKGTEEENQIALELNEAIENLDVEDIAPVRIAKKTGIYQDSAQLSKENKSSAYILLILGILGVITLVLIFFDVIPLYSGMTSKIITSIVMGTLFVVFIIMGIASMKNAKKLEEMATSENDLTNKIIDFCEQNLSAEMIDNDLRDEEWDSLEDEIKYFKRIEHIRELITKQFMNLEEDYVDYMCDEIYSGFYEEE